MLALLPLLTACNDFDTEFSVRSAESTVTVSSDGFARVSETFWVKGLIANNSGGVYVDIPQRFFDTGGSAQWRSFVLLAAKRGLDEEHYFLGHKLQGYSIYIGKSYFKRRRNRSLPPTVNKIGIEYRLGRLIREEGDKQVLVLPAYMASVHDLRAEKKIVLTVPEGGTLRPSDKGANGYDIKSLRPNRFVISFAAGSGDRNPPDIEIEYPPATFPTTTVVDAAYWWISDNLLVFIGLPDRWRYCGWSPSSCGRFTGRCARRFPGLTTRLPTRRRPPSLPSSTMIGRTAPSRLPFGLRCAGWPLSAGSAFPALTTTPLPLIGRSRKPIAARPQETRKKPRLFAELLTNPSPKVSEP